MSKADPYIDNYPPLKEWLAKIGARCSWQVRTSKGVGGIMVERWQPAKGKGFVVLVYPNGDGWDVLTSSDEIRLVEFFREAEKRIGWSPTT